jgi:DDE domain
MLRQPNASSSKCCTPGLVQFLGAHAVQEAVEEPMTPADPTPTKSAPRVIDVDKNAAYPKAEASLKTAGILPASVELRQVKYLNNLIDAATIARIKRLVKLGMGFLRVRDSVADRCRGYAHDEHAPERSDPWRRKKRQLEANDIHRSPVWSGYLS